MPGDSRSWAPAIGIVAFLIAVGAGVAFAVIVDGGDHPKGGRVKPGVQTVAPTATTETTETTETEAERTAPPTATTTAPRPDPQARGIERAVATLVESSEVGDGSSFCKVLGRRGSGPEAVSTCARAAGIDLRTLPSSDELSVEAVRVSGGRATASLAGGAEVSLRRVGRRWRVTGVQR
jgi:hypothetical protein